MEQLQPWDRKALLGFWGRVDSATFLFNRVGGLTERFTYLLATLMLFIIGAADYWTGVELMLPPFYALPCLLVDWRIGRRPALLYGVFASYIQWLIGTFGGHPYSHALYFYWDLLLNLVFYGVLIWLVAKLRVALEMERMLSRVDFLTRLANRRSFEEAVKQEFHRCERHRHVLTIVLIDCDDFNDFIDARGFSSGDLLLAVIGDALKTKFRMTDFMARTGLNEFALILPETPHARSEIKLKKFHRELEELALMRGWPVTVSMACTVFHQMPGSPEIAVTETRNVLRHIKQTGKNRMEQRVWGAGISAVSATKSFVCSKEDDIGARQQQVIGMGRGPY